MSSEPSLVDELWESLVTAVIAAGALLWWLLRRPWLLGATLLVTGVVLVGGWLVGVLVLGLALIGVAGLRGLRPDLFARLVSRPLRRAQTGSRYRRDWTRVSDLCGLTKELDGRTLHPDLLRVEVGDVFDRLLLRMVTGQALADYERACPELASSLGGHLARVWADKPGRLWLEVIRDDALADILPARPIPATDEVDQIEIGVREDGRPWVLRLLGTHVFVAGVQGAGKGSVIWSVLRGLSRSIHSGVVQVWAVDPKGGMELAFGRPLFTRFACETTAAMVELLEDAVMVMDARCARLAGVTRMHHPTVDEPLVLVIVDELSTLTAYEPHTKLRTRATAAISALLARGRAAAVVVLAAAQDPRKEVVSFRSLFPTKIALRLDTPSQVDMVLGDGMHQMGALADRIPAGRPGVGYVTVEGIREPVRVRAAYVADEQIHAQTLDYPAPVADPALLAVDGGDPQ
ncbi:FtsK/SpoIIIE domain-containing protein [Nakamurella multipartita]|uniref:Cell division FtsK/SpoIIIE n=1 Tax=Nakamurella multipartita (strain ATCC 700099 / DSM 44233 / CIP 104796 / JCM 9543 / NBRC 105858 / Y-104) TaxID=479431 RepID=C8X873_NAKMY|nr:cell division protein FtsK [Nakamurella multipartita]ACV77049.1 cell division FtsK/SpoIIIE [Nakamurella multipartita DSM 44233]